MSSPRAGGRADLVARPRLLARLAATTAPLAVVHAPAGYGKTTLLAQWSAQDARPFAWVDRGEGGDDAALMAALADQLDDARGPCVLVLDDPPALRDASALALVADVAQRQSPGSLVVVATRGEPALPLGRMRVEGELLELDAGELAMTDAEAIELLEVAGVAAAVGPAELARLCACAEGWPAALRLAALAVGAAAAPGRFAGDDGARAAAAGARAADATTCVADDGARAAAAGARAAGAAARFAGDDRFAADYLRDAVLGELDPADVAFLQRCAVLGELSGSLCDVALDRDGSGELLRALARAGLPLTAVDRGERRFRMHPLLAQTLVAELRRCEPAAERPLQHRAGAWHVGRGDVARALDAALAAGDDARAGELLWSIAPACAAGGRTRELAGWLERIGEARLAQQPALALSAGVERLASGDRDAAQRWAGVVEERLGDARAAAPTAAGGAAGTAAPGTDRGDALGTSAPRSTLHGGLATLRAGLARGGARRLLDDVRDATALAADDPSQATARLLAGAAHRLLGEDAAAREQLELAARRCAVATPVIRATALALLALAELEQGDRAAGVELAVTAADELAAAGLSDDPACALAFAVAACARAEDGDVEQARDDAARAGRLLAALPDPPPWLAVETRVALARALLRLSDAAAARKQLERAGRLLRGLPDASGLRTRIDDGWERADSFAIGAVAGPAALTIAELRVLRFLPSHLTFREIGARLHVSANTVKTQAHAVYRKLDASSRSEAVARASRIGLVDG